MRTLSLLAFLTCSIAASAQAGDPPRPVEPPSLVGRWAFTWTKGTPACKQVDAARVKKWKSCLGPDPEVGTASGKPLVASCKLKGKGEDLVFATKAECTEERETQAANGD